MNAVVKPLSKALAKDESFTLTAAKEVNSRIRKDRAAALNNLKEFEFSLAMTSLPKLSEDLSAQQLFDVNVLMVSKFGATWFKNRTTHPNAITMNLPVLSAICSSFFARNDDMVGLVQDELKSEAPGGIVVDETVLTEFFMSADDLRSEAWKQVIDLYEKARDRLQRKARSQKHRDKHRDKLTVKVDSEDSSAKEESEEVDDSVEPTNDFVVPIPPPPVKSIASSKQDLLTLANLLLSEESNKKKFRNIIALFESHCNNLESRVGSSCLSEESEIGMSLAVGVVTQELLHAEDSDAPRLNKLLREFEMQGAFVRFSSKIVDSTIREIGDRLRETLEQQSELFGGLVRRWLPRLTDSQATLSKVERAAISNVSLNIESIFNDLSSEVDGRGKRVDRSCLLWFLGGFCHLLAHACFYHYDSLASSTFTRMGQYVTTIGGTILFLIVSSLGSI